MRQLCLAAFLSASFFGQTAAQTGPAASSETLYQQRCARCHDGGVPRAPNRSALRVLPPERIRKALTEGSMSDVGKELSSAQIDSLARLLGAESKAVAAGGNTRCTMPADAFTDAFTRPHWNGWGNGLDQRRYQTATMARLAPADVPRLKVKWAFGFAGAARVYAQPTVVGGRLFMGSADGTVYALDAASGCTHWTFGASSGVRTAIAVARAQNGWALYFGDQAGTAYRLDALTGKELWRTQVDAHPKARITAAPVLHEGVLYVAVSSIEEFSSMEGAYGCCTFRGSVVALDAESGKQLWKSYTIAAVPAPTRKSSAGVQQFGPAGGAVWSAPTIDPVRRRIYVTTGNRYADPPADGGNAILAFALGSGERLWVQQKTAADAYTMACNINGPGLGNCPSTIGPDFDFGSSAVLVALPGGKRALIAGQKSGTVHALDPDRDGAPLWQVQVGVGGTLGGVQWGPAADERNVYVAVSDVRLHAVTSGTPGAQPYGNGFSLKYDGEIGGGLWALDLATGKVAWKTPHPGCEQRPGCSPAQSAAVTVIPGIVFSGGVDGHLRAYATDSGRIVWDADTRGPHETVNRVAAQGGSLDGPGPVVVDGVVYVGSGYALFGGMPGNVLLAYSIDGK
jgi:polyvinyl alcohol dehydrogenase (cytochrome)